MPPATPPEDEFKVVISKTTGQTLGLSFSDGPVLEVLSVGSGGLVRQWNRGHPELAVKPGYSIVEVNGIRHDRLQMVDKCSRDMTLELVLRRGQGVVVDDAPPLQPPASKPDHPSTGIARLPRPLVSQSAASVRRLVSTAVGALRRPSDDRPKGVATGGRTATAQQPKCRRVRFSGETDTHYVAPYSSHYGVHPSDFDFGPGGEMLMKDDGFYSGPMESHVN